MEKWNPSANKFRNRILSGLSLNDAELVRPHLRQVQLPLRTVVEGWGRPTDSIHFVDCGLASVVTGKKVEVEVGLIGYEGFTGLSAVLGASGAADTQTYMQIGGAAQKISVGDLRRCIDTSPTLRHSLLLFVSAFIAQLSSTAMANAKGSLSQRLARWLLMAQDRIQSSTVPLTHEFLALMLGVRRSGVSLAIEHLVARGVIRSSRGQITIVDRPALLDFAGPFYQASHDQAFDPAIT